MNSSSTWQIMSYLRNQQSRSLSLSPRIRSSDLTSKPKPPTTPSSAGNSSIIGQPKLTPTRLDRIFLKWSGQFKSANEIPASVPGDVIHKARSYARIRINIGFLLLAAGFSGIMIMQGREAVKRGDSIEKQNLEWHRQINEEHRKKS